LLAALFVIVAASALHAQIVETGIITGVVKDNTGAVIPERSRDGAERPEPD
jgi:hypothetical protein